MGIHGLMKLLYEEAPAAIKEQEMENFTGRKVAIDASMAMYQFLIAVRSGGPSGNPQASSMLTNESGDVTSHIQGMFNRTIKMMSAGIKPVYIFDGKPPNLKSGELAKRLAKRAKAETDLAKAKEAGDMNDIDKFSRRLVKVTKQHSEDCKELLRLMGVPVFDAPCEAEAQCAELAKNGKVYAVATEDMDALTFHTPKLLRKLTFAQGKDKQPILEIDVKLVLQGLELTYEQFVDLCILCGCDYCSSIRGIGPKTALKLIKQYKSIENILKILKKDKKYSLSDDWFVQKVPKRKESEDITEATDDVRNENTDQNIDNIENNDGNKVTESTDLKTEVLDEGVNEKDDDLVEETDISYFENVVIDDNDDDNIETDINEEDDEYDIYPPLYVQARKLFLEASVIPADQVELKWTEPNEVELKAFLIDRMGFNSDRVANGIKKLQEAQQNKAQKRLDSFFAPVSTIVSTINNKRKIEDTKNNKSKGGNNKMKKR